MAHTLKHLALLGLATPVSLLGYHYFAGAHGSEGGAPPRSLTEAVDRMVGTPTYALSDLRLLERDLWYVETRYVQPERLDPDAMFQGALDAVERGVPEVMFQREPAGKKLQVSVGKYTTTLVLEPINSFVALHEQLRRVAVILEQNLGDEIPKPEVEYALINGALSTLDPHTMLMPPADAADMAVDNQGEFGGLGIEISLVDGRLTIKQPIAGTPASKAGLRSDDTIVRIEDESTINMDLTDAVSKLRGPVGAPVTISVMRKGFDAPRKFTIIRALIRLNPVEGQLLPGDVAYVWIKNFNEKVDADLDRLLAEFRSRSANGIKGLVLDLRSNPGGYLNQAVEVSDRFLASGVVVSTVEGGKGGRRDVRRAAAAGTEPDYPIALLTNGSSASASEIVAGALHNHERAVIIGERTFGKGSVQHLYENDDTSQLKLTVARYLTPGDQSIQSVGIAPDILVQPTILRPAEKAGEEPVVSLYWREWVSHEADLDHHLEQVADTTQPPAYTVRYLRPPKDESDEASDLDKRVKDYEVQLAREVLLAAKGPRTAEVLATAGPVVDRHQKTEADKIVAAFRGIGLDWSAGPAPKAPALTARLDLGPDGLLRAGEDENVGLEVTNHGTEPVYQLSAITTSDNTWLDRREFSLGRINPGETKRAVQPVALPDGYGSELAPVTITFRAPDSLGTSEQMVETQGRALPRFRYELSLVDDGSQGSKGNGNRMPEVGETVALVLTLTNVGDGDAREPFARLKNKSGKALDLENASAEPGTPTDAQGKSCTPDTEGCFRLMAPGASVSSTLTFALVAPPPSGAWELDLSVGDNRAYDYAAVQKAGFYAYFQLAETLKLTPGQPLGDHEREPPRVTVTRQPELKSANGTVVLSGRVEDPHGLRDVIVFQGDQKIAYQGGADDLTSMPFTVDASLKPGLNEFVILARDWEKMASTWSWSTWYEAPASASSSARSGG